MEFLMPLTHEEITKKHDKAYLYPQETREKASECSFFYHVSHWDDNMLSTSQLSYRGEFDMVGKAVKGVQGDLTSNPVQNDFEPVDEDREDAADFMDTLYRADSHSNTSIESFDNAELEMIVCGFGAWELSTEYESIRGDSNNQVLIRRPIAEANNTLFFDPSAKLLDKSDAKYSSHLTGYTEEGFISAHYELTGEELTDKEIKAINPSSFSYPEGSFSWVTSGSEATFYLSTFYHKELVKTKILNMVNPLGENQTMYESDLKDVMDDMIDEGWTIESDKTINRWEIRKYIVSGQEILNGDMVDGERVGVVIPGEHIPVVPIYGERAIVNGQETWEGIIAKKMDAQKLRDFNLSYLADIVSRSPRSKPIVSPEEVAGFEKDYSLTGVENNLPYVRMNRKTQSGEPLPYGPIRMLPEQPIPSALVASIDLSRQAVEDGANPGITQDIADVDLSTKSILALQARLDLQSVVYQEHRKHGKRRDGEICASMYAEIYDVPRRANVELKNGTRKKVETMEQILDAESGEFITINDIYNTEFKVYSSISASYSTQKDQTLDRVEKLLQGINPADPKYNMLLLQYLSLMDGIDFDDIRDYVKNEQLMLGFRKPDDDEEEALLEEAKNQQQEPSAEMLVGLGEKMKGEAALLEQKRKGIEMQLEFQNKDTANKVDSFEAQTKRMEAQIKAFLADAKIQMDNMNTFSKDMETRTKMSEFVQPITGMSDEAIKAELYGQA